MFRKEEHILEQLLEGNCISCQCPASVREEWHLNKLYRFGSCDRCGREEGIVIRRI